uniref:COesterase domain-containing protein n=1 Tax=Ascaris lumbricoides TaxID=6252 RepID=A0A0M3IVD7_ASCLU
MDAPAELIRDSEWAPVMEFVDFPWVPVIDGDFLIEQPSSSLKQGTFKTAPLLAGSNLDESIYFIVYQLAVLRCLMDAPAELIRDSEWAPVMEFVDFPWVPVIDGDFLIEQPSSSLKQGTFKTAPLLAGSNLDESIYFIVYQLADVFPPKDFFTKKDFIKSRDVWLRSVTNLLPRQMIKSSIGLASIIHEYEPADLPVKPVDWMNALDKMLGDLQFTCNVNDSAISEPKQTFLKVTWEWF